MLHLAFSPPRSEDLPDLGDTAEHIPARPNAGVQPDQQVPQALQGTNVSAPMQTTAASLSGEDWNLVVIAVDTLRADMLGSYGNPEGLTPNLDRLARRGWRLANLTSPAPWTLPSFASLMTGLHPQTHGAGRRHQDDGKVRRQNITPLDASHTTLAETLREAGFRHRGFLFQRLPQSVLRHAPGF